jgi:hypothetical protein
MIRRLTLFEMLLDKLINLVINGLQFLSEHVVLDLQSIDTFVLFDDLLTVSFSTTWETKLSRVELEYFIFVIDGTEQLLILFKML